MPSIEKANSRVFVLALLLLSLLFGLWVQITPLGSAPDESAHYIKSAGVIRGQFTGHDVPHWTIGTSGWVFDRSSGVRSVLVVGDGKILATQSPDSTREDLDSTLGVPTDALVGFNFGAIHDERYASYQVMAELNDGSITTLSPAAENNIAVVADVKLEDGRTPVKTETTLGIIEESQLTGRLEYSHWSTYLDIERQFDAARNVQACFVAQAQRASCGMKVEDVDIQGEISELPLTMMGRYTPIIYFVPGLGTLLGPSNSSWYLARGAGALVSASLVALAVVVLSRRSHSLLGLVISMVPAAFFLGSVVNPSGMEILASITMWIATPSFLQHDRHDPWEVVAFTASGLVVILARPLGMLYYIVIVGLCVLITGTLRSVTGIIRRRGLIACVHGIALLFASWWYIFVYNNVVDPSRAEYLGPRVPVTERILHSLFGNVSRVIADGIGDLGSHEVGIPAIALTSLIILVTWLVSAGWSRSDRLTRQALIVLSVLVVVFVVATDFNYMEILRGYGAQGRHAMPLLVGIPILATRNLQPSRMMTVTTLSVWATSQFLAGLTALRRYSVGMIDDNFLEMFYFPIWKPPLGIRPTLILLGVLLITASVAVARLEPLARRAEGGD